MSRDKRFLVVAIGIVLAVPSSHAQTLHRDQFHPPEGMLTAGLRETATHRTQLPALHIGHKQHMPAEVTFWVHVDDHGTVLEARDFRADGPEQVEFSADAVTQAIRKIVYQPFLQKGSAAEAWVQDEVVIVPEFQPLLSSPAEAPFPAVVKPTDFSIRLARSGCFGSCPIYSVTIHGDGKVEFHGEEFVAIPGDYQVRISREDASELLDRVRAADFFALNDEYVAGVTDNPTYQLDVIVGTKKKSVIDYVGSWVGMPEAVEELEEAVDKTAGTDRWVTGSAQTLEAMRAVGIDPKSQRAGVILLHAVQNGRADAVRSLLDAGAPVTGVDEDGHARSLLVIASLIPANQAQLEIFKALLENDGILADRTGMRFALGRATEAGRVELSRLLIAAGADPTQPFYEFLDPYATSREPDETYLMRAAASGVWDMLDDALSRPHDIHATDKQGRSALDHVVWSAPPTEDIFPMIDRLLAAGATKEELTKTLAGACDSPQWRDGFIKRGANPTVCDHRK